MIRRNNVPTLNFFKENGPKDFLEFKKVDTFSLVELLLNNEKILKALHEIIFNWVLFKWYRYFL
mgnify:CR=1 FL=1